MIYNLKVLGAAPAAFPFREAPAMGHPPADLAHGLFRVLQTGDAALAADIVAPGFSNVMPGTYAHSLTPKQLADVVAFLVKGP